MQQQQNYDLCIQLFRLYDDLDPERKTKTKMMKGIQRFLTCD
jgi:hypothetical protein